MYLTDKAFDLALADAREGSTVARVALMADEGDLNGWPPKYGELAVKLYNMKASCSLDS